MKTSLKKLSTTKVEITANLTKPELTLAQDAAVEELAENIKIPGFRKGKAPASAALKVLDPNELSAKSLDIAIKSSIPQVFTDTKIRPVSVPHVNVTKYVPGESLEYTATADILPEIKLADYKKLKSKRADNKITNKEIDSVLDNIANSYAEKVVVSRPAKLTDEVVIDFKGFKGDEAFDGGDAKDYKLTLGSGNFIPGFEDGIIGHEVGDKFELKLTFPKDYHNKGLAGQKTRFDVLVKQVNEIKKPTIDDALAKKAGNFKNLSELKADIEKNLKLQSDHRIDEKYKDDLVSELAKNSKFDVPDIMIEDNLALIRQELEHNLAHRGQTFDEYIKSIDKTKDDWEVEARDLATLRAKVSLCLMQLAIDEKLSVSDEEVAAKVSELKDVYKNSPDTIKQLSDPRVVADIKNRLMNEKAIAKLVEYNSSTK